MTLQASICIATRDKPVILDRTLASIDRQRDDVPFEVCVADDGSGPEVREICRSHRVEKYVRLENEVYRNPATARNVAFKVAVAPTIIQQSDDVLHDGEATIADMLAAMKPGTFVIATVHNYDFERGRIHNQYTGIENPRPFFFLGAIYRSDLYAAGGYDEDFVAPGYDDNWHADSLVRGLGLVPVFLPHVHGLHHDHSRPRRLSRLVLPSQRLYERKVRCALRGGSWLPNSAPWDTGMPLGQYESFAG